MPVGSNADKLATVSGGWYQCMGDPYAQNQRSFGPNEDSGVIMMSYASGAR